MKKVGDRIRLLREEKEWNQLELSKRIGINNSVLSRIEAGKRPVEDNLLDKFAEIFHCSTDYLLGRTNSRGETLSAPTDAELEEFLHNSNVKFDGTLLDDQDKEDIINFLKMIWNRKKDK